MNKSGFTSQLHRLVNTLWGLFATFSQLLQALQTEACYVIGSFPVAGYHNVRIGRNRLLGHKAYRDRCASKRSWDCGFKVRIVATTDGVPIDFYVHTDSEANVTGLRVLAPKLPTGSVLHTNAGYTDYAWKDLFEEATGNRQRGAHKKISGGCITRPKTP